MKHAVHVDHVFGELQLTGIQAGEIENVVDQAQQVGPAIADQPRIIPVLLVAERSMDFSDHQVREPDDGVQRRAQLVAHRGEEMRLRLTGRGSGLQRRGEFSGRRLQFPLGRFQFRNIAAQPVRFAHGAGCQMLIDDRTGQTERDDHDRYRRDRDGERGRGQDVPRHVEQRVWGKRDAGHADEMQAADAGGENHGAADAPPVAGPARRLPLRLSGWPDSDEEGGGGHADAGGDRNRHGQAVVMDDRRYSDGGHAHIMHGGHGCTGDAAGYGDGASIPLPAVQHQGNTGPRAGDGQDDRPDRQAQVVADLKFGPPCEHGDEVGGPGTAARDHRGSDTPQMASGMREFAGIAQEREGGIAGEQADKRR